VLACSPTHCVEIRRVVLPLPSVLLLRGGLFGVAGGGQVKQGAEQMYRQLAITADDIAEVIAFAVTRPRRMTLNEILIRPTAQP